MSAIKLLLKSVPLFLLLIIFTNCNNKRKLIDDENEIISLLINDTYNSYFKIPKKYKNTLEKSKILINDKFIVVVDVDMKPFALKYFKSEYQILLDKLYLIEDSRIINLENLTVNKEISLLKLDDSIFVKMKNKFEYYNFHEFVSFSRIAFNNKKDKAIIAMVDSTSSLASSYDLCILKMENGKWKIIDFENIEIS